MVKESGKTEFCVSYVTEEVQRRENEDATLTPSEKQELKSLLEEHVDNFKLRGEPTDSIEHVIHTSISVSCYRLPAYKKHFLKKKLDLMLEQRVMEECKGP